MWCSGDPGLPGRRLRRERRAYANIHQNVSPVRNTSIAWLRVGVGKGARTALNRLT
jgi:hypothetical protein